jgi:hypothetical protein
MSGHAARMGKMKDAYKILDRNVQVKWITCRGEDNILACQLKQE